MFSSVRRTPLGVKSGSPFGKPSTGLPATWRPKTATRALSGKVREGGDCFGFLGRFGGEGLEEEEKGSGVELGNCLMKGFGVWLFLNLWLCIWFLFCLWLLTLGEPVLLIWISWMILKLPGVDEIIMGEALILLNSVPPTWNDLAVAEIVSLNEGLGVTGFFTTSFPANLWVWVSLSSALDPIGCCCNLSGRTRGLSGVG